MLATLTAQDAIEVFRANAAAGRVYSATTGDYGMISAGDVNAIVSVAAAALRHASGRSDLDQVPYAAFADDLPLYAQQDADARGLRDVANRVSRARRFVYTVDGRVRERRRTGPGSVPDGWVPLYDVLRGLRRSNHDRMSSHLAVLAQLLATQGVLRPQDLPDRNRLRYMLRGIGQSESYTANLIVAYRTARELLADRIPDLPDIDRCPVLEERGLRSIPDIVERLERRGYVGPVRSISTEEAMRMLAPRFHSAVHAYIQEHRGGRSAEWPKKIWGAASRALACLASLGRELEELYPFALLLERVEREDTTAEVSSEIDWSDFMDQSSPGDDECGQATMTLLETVALEMADAAAENSPLEIESTSSGTAYFTETLISDIGCLRDVAIHAARNAPKAIVARLMAARAEIAEFIRSMRKRNAQARVHGRKRKETILELVTLPQIVCVGLPRLRDHVIELRSEWQEALDVHGGDMTAPLVRSAYRRYEMRLEEYLVFAVLTADGLRVQNYANARLGPIGDDEMVTSVARCGTKVRSYCHIQPVIQGGEIVAVRTGFYGKDHKRVKLKIARRGATGDWRRRLHLLRPNVVDFDLLQEYLVNVRPHRLVAQGLLPSAEDYDLDRDVNEWHFALFVSPNVSAEPLAAVTGAFDSDVLSRRYGKALHWICVEALNRDLPRFGSRQMAKEYRALFSAHVSRLLAATYLFGIRGRLQEAMTFIDDTAEVVARRYTVVESSLIGKRGWEDPHFFDEEFDRLWETVDRTASSTSVEIDRAA